MTVNKHLIGRHNQKDHGRKHGRSEHIGVLSGMEPFVSTSKDRTLFREAWNRAKDEGEGWWGRSLEAQAALKIAQGEMSRQEHARRKLSREEDGFLRYHMEENAGQSAVAAGVSAGLLVAFTRNPNMAREWIKFTERASRAGRVSPKLNKPLKEAFTKRPARISQEVDDIFAKAFDGNFGGLQSVMTHTRMNSLPGTITVEGTIRKGNSTVGMWRRSFAKNGEVHHDLLTLDKRSQGTGFAKEFYDHSMRQYKDMGFDHVTILANISVGGYAWASKGFQFQPGSAFASRLDLALSAPRVMRQHPGKYTTMDVLRAQAKILSPGTSPQQVSQIGKAKKWTMPDDKMEHWLGKDILLGKSWLAIKTL